MSHCARESVFMDLEELEQMVQGLSSKVEETNAALAAKDEALAELQAKLEASEKARQDLMESHLKVLDNTIPEHIGQKTPAQIEQEAFVMLVNEYYGDKK